MSKAVLIDLTNNEVAKSYLKKSLKGEKTAQRILYDSLAASAKKIQYSFYYRAKKAGLNLRDLDDEFISCYMQLLKNYDETKGSVLSFFKILYFNRLRTIIKKESGATRSRDVLAIGKDADYFESDCIEAEPQTRESKVLLNNDELANIILGEESKVISEYEKRIYRLYLDSYTIKEMSRMMKCDYNLCLKFFKSGRKKIEKFLRKINIESKSF